MRIFNRYTYSSAPTVLEYYTVVRYEHLCQVQQGQHEQVHREKHKPARVMAVGWTPLVMAAERVLE